MNENDARATWLFDLGNSRLKGAWLREGQPAQRVALDWAAPDFDVALRAALGAWPAPARALVASVAAAAQADRLREALRAWPRAEVQWLRSPRAAFGITNAYAIPERLGIDRFLAMVAARAATTDGAGVIVVGCGTALTLDAVDAAGRQRQGMIAPSPTLMLRALRDATAIEGSHPEAFDDESGDDSARAMRLGCTRAAACLVEWYGVRQDAMPVAAPICLHGGWSAALLAMFDLGRERVRVLEDAVLQGLAIWARQTVRAET